ncbi:methyl jasmonate esterase 1-like [Solanum stenotomum]|uniref:methyl jasmonate esterase 1-like n=1 Tax=Solanum stenotomum TaxID=172797 RepID=UPI0020D104D4|nr:methyl jasmonate esterase 1-like [Solanum stenotomum]
MEKNKSPLHFVLVHTAFHGAWSWYKIVALMTSSGHNVTTLDLGGSGINPKQALEITHFADYVSPLMEFMASLPANNKIILVGHAFGGFAISKAMETFPEKISVAVFLGGLMPGPNIDPTTIYTKAASAVIGKLDNCVTYENGPTNPPTTIIVGPKYLATNIYHLSPIEDLALATTLVRPIYLFPAEDISKEMVLSSKMYGSVRRVVIVAPENNALAKEFLKLMIEKNPPDEVKEIEGSDHDV